MRICGDGQLTNVLGVGVAIVIVEPTCRTGTSCPGDGPVEEAAGVTPAWRLGPVAAELPCRAALAKLKRCWALSKDPLAPRIVAVK